MNADFGPKSDQPFDLIKWVNETDEKDISASKMNAAQKSTLFSAGSEILFKPKKIEELLKFVRTEAALNKEQISPETAAKLQKLCHSIASSKFAKSSYIGQIKGFFEDRKISKQVEHATREVDLYALQNPGTDLEGYAKNLDAVLQNASRKEKAELAKLILGPNSFLAKCQELPIASESMKKCFFELARVAYREGQLGVSLPASKLALWAQKELKAALHEEMFSSLKPKIKLKLSFSQLTNPLPSLKIPPQKGLTSLVRTCIADAAAEALAEVVGRPKLNLHPKDEQAISSVINVVRQFVSMRLELAGDKPVKLLVGRPKETETQLKKDMGIANLSTAYMGDFSLKMLTICERFNEVSGELANLKTKPHIKAHEPVTRVTTTSQLPTKKPQDPQDLEKRASQFKVLPDAIVHFPELFAAESVTEPALNAVVNRMRRDSMLREFLVDDYKAALREGRIQPEDIMPELLLDIAQNEEKPNMTLISILKDIVANGDKAKFNEYKVFINEQFKKLLG